MDAIGTIISLIDLTKRIVQYTRDVKGANQERLKLSSEVSSVQAMLLVLQDYTTESHGDGSNPRLSGISVLAIEGGPLDQCKVALEAISSHLKPSPGAKKALMWPFQSGEINSHLAKVERLKTLISLLFQASLQ
jgi:hypothetical protein